MNYEIFLIKIIIIKIVITTLVKQCNHIKVTTVIRSNCNCTRVTTDINANQEEKMPGNQGLASRQRLLNLPSTSKCAIIVLYIKP